jgi:RNA polymerase sigma factor (sigma-70 family)
VDFSGPRDCGLVSRIAFASCARVAAVNTPEPASDHARWPALSESKWFTEEVHPHEPALRAYLRHRFPSLPDIDDVVQDSYLQLLRRKPTGRIASVRAYLFTVAHHAVLKVFRKRRIFSEVPVNELPAWRLLDGGQNVAETANTHQREALLAEAIATLPGRCREVFKLRVARGLAHAEIAAQLGLSEATVRVQVARGLQKCAQFLRERGLGDEQ